MNTAIDLGVYPVHGETGRYHVKSSGRGVLYLVDLDDLWNPEDLQSGYCACGCRDYEVRSGMMLYQTDDCKHIRQAKFYRTIQRCFGGAKP